MGRIKTIPVKRATFEIFNRHKDELPSDFEKLKELLPNYVKTPSKKIRNAIAGYLSRLMKQRTEVTEKTQTI